MSAIAEQVQRLRVGLVEACVEFGFKDEYDEVVLILAHPEGGQYSLNDWRRELYRASEEQLIPAIGMTLLFLREASRCDELGDFASAEALLNQARNCREVVGKQIDEIPLTLVESDEYLRPITPAKALGGKIRSEIYTQFRINEIFRILRENKESESPVEFLKFKDVEHFLAFRIQKPTTADRGVANPDDPMRSLRSQLSKRADLRAEFAVLTGVIIAAPVKRRRSLK